MSAVIVLNADMTILGTTTWQRAVRLVVTGKAVSLADSERKIHTTFNVPKVIRLIKAIRNLWRSNVPWSKGNVHVRDGYICQYCGKELKRTSATIDHVIPQAQGGKNSWDNTVTSCFPCNNSKQDRTPSQAHMTLRRQPWQPTIMEFLLRKIQSEGLENILSDLNIY